MSRRNNKGMSSDLVNIFIFFIEAIVQITYWVLNFIIFTIPKIIYFIWSIAGYGKSEYKLITHKSLINLVFDKGAYGEYLIYRHLIKFPGTKRWLFNTYLPRENNDTTEVDVIMLHSSGVYVFESKNYNGWIFGNETQENWTQCLKRDGRRCRKFHFLNPIIQNKLHLKYLNRHLEGANVPVYSIILFGNRCKLKNITLSSGLHTVICRKQLVEVITEISKRQPYALSDELIDAEYNKFIEFIDVPDEIKVKHIEKIKLHHPDKSNSHNTIVASQSINTQPTVNIQQVYSTYSQNARNNVSPDTSSTVCPLCGNMLVIRTVKNGINAGKSFWGCSTYPNCKYTNKR